MKDIWDYHILNYKFILRETLASRIGNNPSYSMRAFARDLEMSSGYLSDLLNNKKDLSIDKAKSVSQLLKFDEEKTELFLLLWKLHKCVDEETRLDLQAQIEPLIPKKLQYLVIDCNQFDLISDWYHLAIVEMFHFENPPNQISEISSKLGVSEDRVRLGLNKLMLLGMIEKEQDYYKPVFYSHKIPKPTPSKTIRDFHKIHMEKAKKALDIQDFSKRDISGRTVRTDPKNIPLIKEEIKKFRENIASIASKGDCSTVYHLGVQFFRLDHD